MKVFYKELIIVNSIWLALLIILIWISFFDPTQIRDSILLIIGGNIAMLILYYRSLYLSKAGEKNGNN